MRVQKGNKLIEKKVPQQINDSEEEVKFHLMEIEDEEIPVVLPPYIPPRKSNAKLAKKPKEGNISMYTPLLLEEFSFEGEVLGKIPHLKMED